MVKECIVKLNNDIVTVVGFGEKDIQLPAIHKDAKTIYVSYEDGKYSVVDKGYKPNGVAVEKKITKKKTTKEEIAKELEVAVENINDA